MLRFIDKNGESKERAELDLMFIQYSICFTYLKNVPVKTVGVSHSMGDILPNHVTTIQGDLQFGGITLHQEF